MPDDPTQTEPAFEIRCADAVELVTDYLDGELNKTDLAAFQAHLDGCEACTVFVDQIRMTVRLTSTTNQRQIDIMPTDLADLVAQLKARAGQDPGTAN